VSGEPSREERRRGRGFHLNPQKPKQTLESSEDPAAQLTPLLSSPLPHSSPPSRDLAMALHAPVLVMSMRLPPPPPTPCAPPFLGPVFRLRDDVSLLLLGFSLGFFSPLVVRVDARLISLLGPAIRCVGSGFRVLLRLI